MAEITWEKTQETESAAKSLFNKRYSYLVLGVGLLAVVVFLLINGMASGRYYMTINELVSSPENVGKNVRVSGAVIGDTIKFDQATGTLSFTVANVTNDDDEIKAAGGLAAVLHQAVENPNGTRMQVVWHNAEMPDLLQHEAQAIMTGKLGSDGIFYANQVLLKCPTRYSDEVPAQVSSSQ